MTESGVPPQEPQPPQQTPPPAQPPYSPIPDPYNLGPTKTGLQPHVAGLLCYVLGWVTGLIFLLIEPENKFVRFHAMQSLILFVAIHIVQVLLTYVIPFHMGFALGSLVGLLGGVCWIVGMVMAVQGRWFRFPIVGDYVMRTVNPTP
jgi:uncharacterized membrane protein